VDSHLKFHRSKPMGTAADRRALKEARREARRREGAERDRQGLAEWAWWYEGLEGTPTEEIVGKLASLGIETDEARLRELARTHSTADAVGEAWLAQSTATGHWRDYPWMAALALWPRWAPDVFSLESFAKQHLPVSSFAGQEPDTPEEGERQWKMAQAVMDLVAPPDGPPRPDLLDELSDLTLVDVGKWLVNLPYPLAGLGMVDEALEIGARMAPVHDTPSFLGDRAVILAEAGRQDEALKQVEENLTRFPVDVWVRINAGDVHKHCGDPAAAERMYRDAMALADGDDDLVERADAVLHLVDLLRETGHGAEADALVAAEGDALDEWAAAENGYEDDYEDEEEDRPVEPPSTVVRSGPKVGRNDPCPFGSGKKYKRCCAA
jgi:SEC-C motif-containing protein